MLVNEKQQYFLVKKSNYRPQRSWAKVMFLQVCVILFTGGVCLSACWDTTSPRAGADTPQEQTPPGGTHPTGMYSCSSHAGQAVHLYLYLVPRSCHDDLRRTSCPFFCRVHESLRYLLSSN